MQLIRSDSNITNAILHHLPRNSFFDSLFALLSGYESAIFIWIIFFLILLAAGIRHKKFIAQFLVAVFSTSVLVNLILKNIFHRMRPHLINIDYACVRGYSFPSGHAAVAFAAAVVLSQHDPKRKVFYYTVAALICLSRVYLDCHYLGDTVIGGVIGYLIGRLTVKKLKV